MFLLSSIQRYSSVAHSNPSGWLVSRYGSQLGYLVVRDAEPQRNQVSPISPGFQPPSAFRPSCLSVSCPFLSGRLCHGPTSGGVCLPTMLCKVSHTSPSVHRLHAGSLTPGKVVSFMLGTPGKPADSRGQGGCDATSRPC